MVLDGVTSDHSRRLNLTGWFFASIKASESLPAFTRALVQGVNTAQIAAGRSALTLNLWLSPVRKLARDMSDNVMLNPATAAAIEQVAGVERRGTRAGN